MAYDPYDIKGCVTVEFDDGDIIIERSALDLNNSGQKFRGQHTVLEGETLASIAYQYYGDSGYWVMIADVNSIYEPLNDLRAGMLLLIP